MYNQQPPQNPQQAPMAGGYLYPNLKKTTANSPDQKGKIRIGEDIVQKILAGERDFYISGWFKPDKKQQQHLSVRLKPIEPKVQGQQYGATPQPQQPQAGMGWGQQTAQHVPRAPVIPQQPQQYAAGGGLTQATQLPQMPDDEIPF